MDRPTPGAQRRAALAILAVVSIPLVSVSTVVLLGDVAAPADHSSLVRGLFATVTGALAGLLVHHGVRRIVDGVVSIATTIVDRGSVSIPYWAVGTSRHVTTTLAPVRVEPFRGSPVCRRGPPVGLD